MVINNIDSTGYHMGLSVLNRANRQPELAGQLIQRTVQQTAQARQPAQPVPSADNEGAETRPDNESAERPTIDIRV